MPTRSDADYFFTSESVTEGQPDKVADQVADAVVDAALAKDPFSRVACETLVTTGLVLIAGEITTSTYIDLEKIARETLHRIGYDDGEFGFGAGTCAVLNTMDKQSPDIAQGLDAYYKTPRAYSTRSDVEVTERDAELDIAGAGDQGMVIGYACTDTPELMPLPIALAHDLARRLAQVRKDGVLPYLGPDGTALVTVGYRRGQPVSIERVVICAQHRASVDSRTTVTPDLWDTVVAPALPGDLQRASNLREGLLVNPTGRFVVGGPRASTGLTGRKQIVDSYGGMARHGGGAFSGKDPSNVDRSGAYAARWVAKNIVAAGLADRVEVQIGYAIGVARPVSVYIETFGTARIAQKDLIALIDDYFDLRPGAFRSRMRLHEPIYGATAAYGHFGREGEGFAWERTELADTLRAAAGI